MMTAAIITDNKIDTVTAIAVFATSVNEGLGLTKETEKITMKCHMNPSEKMYYFRRPFSFLFSPHSVYL